MEKGGKLRRVAVAVAVMAVWLMCETEAQDTTTATCASSLQPCGTYLNATYPPASCCDPLKVAMTTQKECMCNLLVNGTSTLTALHVNITEALSLPSRCHFTGAIASPNFCTTASPPSASTTNSTPSSSTGSGKNAAHIFAWSAVSIVLAVMASLVVY